MSAPKWMQEAYDSGQKGQPPYMSRETLSRILSDPEPTNWIKWWRRGFRDRRSEAAIDKRTDSVLTPEGDGK